MTVINNGDSLDFGTAAADFFGRGPVPFKGPFFVKNKSNGPVKVQVQGDGTGGIVPLFGPTQADLKPAPDNEFVLETPGVSGDMIMGYLGLDIQDTSLGAKQTTIILSAQELVTTVARIAFRSERDGNAEIYVMDAVDSDSDGTGDNLVRLTNNIARDVNPEWSPDGSKIAFDSDLDGDAEIYLMDPDGSNVDKLTDNAISDSRPTWSPDGSKIAFYSDRDGDFEIYVMNSDGTSVVRLTTSALQDIDPAWSPDGTRIAFASIRSGTYEIYVMDSVDADSDGKGDNLARLTFTNTSRDSAPDWSPDGNKIVFETRRHLVGDEIYVMNPDGSGQTRLTDNLTADDEPAWSHDGDRIAFWTLRDGNYEIYVMNADSSNPVRLTNSSSSEFNPDFSPGIVP